MTNNQKDQIARMRESGSSYAAIAKQIGLSENTVKSYCRRQKRSETSAIAVLCRECRNPIDTSKRSGKRFCSDSCRTKWWNKHPRMIHKANCACCGREMLTRRRNERKYCSHHCYIVDRYKKGSTNG